MIQAVVHHRLSGRLRIRAEGMCGQTTLLRRVEQDLASLPAVSRVSGNELTGSLLIEYDPAYQSEDQLLDRLAHVHDITTAGESESNDPAGAVHSHGSSPRLAQAIQSPFDHANQMLLDVTRGYLDLRYSLPVMFVVAGTWKVLKYVGQPPVPWYMYYWMAFNLFSMFRVMEEKEPAATAGAAGESGFAARTTG
jgi:hypothetical protein